MTRRRQFREMEVLAVLLMQGATIPCKRCKVDFTIEDVKGGNVQKEHLHEVALGGADEPFNCAFSHDDCHKTITIGTPATTAGSSVNRIAKATQPERIEKFQVRKRPLDADLVSEPTDRCRKCGEYPDACPCRAPGRKSSFATNRR